LLWPGRLRPNSSTEQNHLHGEQTAQDSDDGIRIAGRYGERYEEVLTPDVLAFLAQLHHEFEQRRQELLSDRRTCWERIAAGEDPDFLRSLGRQRGL
jgi:malate synthase